MGLSKSDLKNLILEALKDRPDGCPVNHVDHLLDFIDEDDLVIAGFIGGYSEVEKSITDPGIVLKALRDDAVHRVASKMGIGA